MENLSQEEVGREMRHQSPEISVTTSTHPRKSEITFPHPPEMNDVLSTAEMSVVLCGHGQKYMCLPCCSDHIWWSHSTASLQSSLSCVTPRWNEQSCNHFPSNNLGICWLDAWKKIENSIPKWWFTMAQSVKKKSHQSTNTNFQPKQRLDPQYLHILVNFKALLVSSNMAATTTGLPASCL